MTTLAVTLAYNNSTVTDEQCGNQPNLKGTLQIVSVVVHSIVFLLGVIGNGLVIFITGFHMKKTVNTVWFLNLAIADFTFVSLLPLSIVNLVLGCWPLGEPLCKINSAMVLVNLHASVYFLTIISVDRCISVLFPLWARNHRTLRRASLVALGIWILSLAMGSPNLYFRKIEQKSSCVKRYSSDKEQGKIIHRDVVISQFILSFAIPFSIITVCYGAIVLKLRRSRLILSSKPFKIITAVIVTFFVCWFPYQVFTLLEIAANKDLKGGQVNDLKVRQVVEEFFSLAFSLAVINSCLNPILYVFMGGRDVQRGLKCYMLTVFVSAFSEEGSGRTVQENLTDMSCRSMNTFRPDTFLSNEEKREEVMQMKTEIES